MRVHEVSNFCACLATPDKEMNILWQKCTTYFSVDAFEYGNLQHENHLIYQCAQCLEEYLLQTN